MVSIKVASLVLCLLLVSQTLRNCSAHTHQGKIMNGVRPLTTTKKIASPQKEFLDRSPAAATRKMGIGGRKMVVEKVERIIGESSKISGAAHYSKNCNDLEEKEMLVVCAGKDTNASNTALGRPQYRSSDQKNSNMLEPKTSKSASLEIPGNESVHFSNTKPHYSQDSKAFSTKANDESSSKKRVSQETLDGVAHKDEAERLVKDANEIVALVHKDYAGMNIPGRNPPINNEEPTH